MKFHSPNRTAFTLIEVLVVMVVGAIISSMVAIALSGAQRQAMETRAQQFVDQLNLTVLQIYEVEATKNVNAPLGAGTSTAPALKSRAIAKLNWQRDHLRCALPDRVQDVIDLPINNFYRIITTTGVGLARVDPADSSATTSWTGGTPPPYESSVRWQSLLRFRGRVFSLITRTGATPADFSECVDGSTANGEWTTENQGAECLYLILATSVVNGEPAAAMLRDRDIEDTDEDGIPEIVDPWGMPIGFLRWPCGYALVSDWNDPPSTATEIGARRTELSKDVLDTLYSDPRYEEPPATASPEDNPFTLYPLVVSAGADGLFDMVGLDSPPSPAISYVGSPFPVSPVGTLGWPTSPAYDFIDPYQDGVLPINQLGARADLVDSGTDNSGDNVVPSFGALR